MIVSSSSIFATSRRAGSACGSGSSTRQPPPSAAKRTRGRTQSRASGSTRWKIACAVRAQCVEAEHLVVAQRRREHGKRREERLHLLPALVLDPRPVLEEGLLARLSGSSRFITTASQATSKSERSVNARRASSITMRSGVTTSRTLVAATRCGRGGAAAARRAARSTSRKTPRPAAAPGPGRARAESTTAGDGLQEQRTRSARRATSGSVTRRSVESVGAQSTTTRS